MDDAIRAFLAALTSNRAPLPNDSCLCIRLAQFQVFAQDASNRRRPVNPKSIEPALIRDFLAARDRMGEKKSSLARKLACLRSVFRYLVRVGQLKVNPAEDVRAPKLPKHSLAFSLRTMPAR